jgi:hypothetical protein
MTAGLLACLFTATLSMSDAFLCRRRPLYSFVSALHPPVLPMHPSILSALCERVDELLTDKRRTRAHADIGASLFLETAAWSQGLTWTFLVCKHQHLRCSMYSN